MKHTYVITGMTCQNCEDKVTKALLSLPEITSVEVNREAGTADVTMSSHIQTSVMQDALREVGDYKISMDTQASMQSMGAKKNHLKDLIPLFIILGSVLLFSVIITFASSGNFSFGMRMFMGGFFVVFGLLKVFKLKDFALAYRDYDIIAMRSTTYAHIYPFIELGLGIFYLWNFVPVITNIITIMIMGVGAFGVYLKLKKKEEILCACLGTVFKVPMTWVTLAEDLLMVVMAAIMLVLF